MAILALPLFTQNTSDTSHSARSPFPVAHRGQFIKQFTGPDKDSGVVCFKFWQLVHASGCPFKCAYCFLQTTTYFRFNKAALMGQVYGNWEQMIEEVNDWLSCPTPRMLIVGELQDGLAFDSAYAAVTGKPLTHHLIPLFAAQKRHRLIFLTKSTLIKHARKLEPTPQVVFSWSVNAEYVGRRWEQGAPLPSSRFVAAAKMQEAGWPIRLRLDPMIPYHDAEENWRDGYAETIDQINRLGPEMVTIGALRASTMGLATAAEQNGRPVDLFGYLSEKDPSGFKYRLPFKEQVALYRFAIERLDRRRITPALCKEDVSVWKEVGLPFKGCHCLLEGADVPNEIVSTDSYVQLKLRSPMGKRNDREHFEDYREQTQVKHEILAAYLPAYFHILKKWDKNLIFIDGFAGRGTYTKADTGETVDGSPLKALRLIAENEDFAAKVSTIFIESDDVLYPQLEQTVNNFYKQHKNIRQPETMHGTFADRVGEIMKKVKGKLAPAFLFVDPCGIRGTSFQTIRDVMSCDKCEAFIFFNIDGVRRIAGLADLSDVLVELMGSKQLAQALYDALRTTTNVLKREQLILSHYRKALNDGIGAQYTVPFRVEHEDRQTASHYLIHATKHPLGFSIMKDVMWRRGHTEYRAGGLEFAQASRTNFIPLFDFDWDSLKRDIAKALERGRLKVAVFCKDWVWRPEDMLCETAYKKALLELEAEGTIEVLSKDGKKVVSANARPKRNGKPTLANDYYVRLPKTMTQ